MFQELMPLLAQRILLLTLSRVSDEQISVNIIPKLRRSDQQDDGAALTTPLRIAGTPKELDEQLPGQLAEFVEAHLGLCSTLESAKQQCPQSCKRSSQEASSTGTLGPESNPCRFRIADGNRGRIVLDWQTARGTYPLLRIVGGGGGI